MENIWYISKISWYCRYFDIFENIMIFTNPGVTYYVRSLTMSDGQTSDDMRHTRYMTYSTPFGTTRLNKLWIPFLDHELDLDLCKTLFDFHIFFLVFNHDLIIYMHMMWHFTHITASNTATMTSHIRSYMKYLIQTCNILVLIL